MTTAAIRGQLPVVQPVSVLERISIEVTNRCGKACWFCYNHSGPGGETQWTADELVSFVTDCAEHGVRAVSFGGGEPLEYDSLFEVLTQLRGRLFRSMTTNGLLLDDSRLAQLREAAPEKVHVSLHFPGSQPELERVIRQVGQLADLGIKSGVNLLVRRSQWAEAATAAARLREAGIVNERIMYLPMRGQDTPTPQQLAEVAGREPFQSMTCLLQCGNSPRFCSIGWDRQVAWCSYTSARRRLPALTYAGLLAALDGLNLAFCGDADD